MRFFLASLLTPLRTRPAGAAAARPLRSDVPILLSGGETITDHPRETLQWQP